MRPATLLHVLALLAIALFGMAYALPNGGGSVAAREPSRVEARSKPSAARRNEARAPKPSAARRNEAREPKPSAARRNEAREPKPSAARRNEAREPKPSVARRNEAREPKPSGTPPLRKRQQTVMTEAQLISDYLCPRPLAVCPISADSSPITLRDWLNEGFECVDIYEDLGSCGGCGMSDVRYDCTAIEGALGTSCAVGACRVDSCADGYVAALDRASCVKL